jgi:hypothetical protein
MTAATIASDAGPLNAARTFFTTIFATAPADSAIVLTTPPSWRVYAIAPDDVDAAVRRACRLSRFGADVYVHVGVQAAAAVGTRPGRGRAADIVALLAVWADLDLEKPGARRRYLPNRGAALRVLRQLPIRPTVIVWSGRGFHWWWCFREALVLDSAEVRAAAERLVRRWQAYVRQCLGGYALDATHDLARVLRVPGTMHTKHATPVVLEDASGPHVDPSELEDVCVLVPDVVPSRPAGPVHVADVDPTAEPPPAPLAALCTDAPEFARLWRRELAPKDASQSGYDFRLAMFAAEAGWSDPDIVALLVAHGRAGGRLPKSARYYAHTVTHARTRRVLRIEVA